MDNDQRTCPLCRTAFALDELQDDFNEWFWAASRIPRLLSLTTGSLKHLDQIPKYLVHVSES
ncbi:hypothetical protein QQ045_024523 [Rhodiola kirilowii]